MANLTYPQTWDLASLAPVPSALEFRQKLDEFKKRLRTLAEATNQLPPVNSQGENVARWVELITEYEFVDATAVDFRALIDCYAAADAENKSYRQLQAELAATTPDREQIATNIEFAVRDAADTDFETFVASAPVLKKNEYFLLTRRRNAKLKTAEIAGNARCRTGRRWFARLGTSVRSNLLIAQGASAGERPTRLPFTGSSSV